MWPQTTMWRLSRYFCRYLKNKIESHPLSFLKAPPYLLLCPSSSMISGMAEAKRARPTVRKRTWRVKVKREPGKWQWKKYHESESDEHHLISESESGKSIKKCAKLCPFVLSPGRLCQGWSCSRCHRTRPLTLSPERRFDVMEVDMVMGNEWFYMENGNGNDGLLT